MFAKHIYTAFKVLYNLNHGTFMRRMPSEMDPITYCLESINSPHQLNSMLTKSNVRVFSGFLYSLNA